MSEEGEGKVVCVTGASGYIASCLVNLLLQRGYTVKATVRDPNDPKTEFLRALDGAKERLQLFKANLLEDGSFDSAVDGCVGVFHTASPVIFSTNDPQAELIDPAVKGTLNILKSCAKFHSVKRVVVTSSIATLVYNGAPVSSDLVVDETWVSKPEVCKEIKNFYALSKTLAEDAAWTFAKENGIDLVTIHPGVVLGTSLPPNLSLSVQVILHLVNGVQTFPGPYILVDVRDVAHAHIQAFEVPTANGRYALVGTVTQHYDILKSLREQFPTLQLPEKFEDEKYEPEPTFQFSKERAQSLGINFTPLEISLRDTIESLKEKGFLNF